jgi:GNAT superfamily N-acetyltransferase
MFRANPEMASLLPRLKAGGYRLVLASNTNALHAEWFERQFARELAAFDARVLSCEAGARKPEAAFFQACVEAAGVPPDECVFIDDKEEFVAAARALGIRGFVYAPDGSLAANLVACGVAVASLPDEPPVPDDARVIIDEIAADAPDAVVLIGELERELSGRYVTAGEPRGLTAHDLVDPRFVFLVGRIDGQPVASAAMRELSPELGEIKRMFVATRWRGRGIAARMLAALEGRARARGYRALRLETGVRQPEAMRVYERAGFVPIPAFGDYTDPLSRCYEKRLR